MDDEARYRAMVTRDRRFDGVFFVGVTTTGIYCRPICPARTPGRTRCEFFSTAVQAESAGFRACFRCRPELAPGNADVDAVDRLVAACMRRIADGALNGDSVDELAAELGVSARHLRRATEMRLGVSPVELAQSRRIALAKQLLQDTGLSLTEIAFAAGFGSVRRFNAMFRTRFGSAPSTLRRTHAPDRAGITLRLDYRAPYDFAHILGFLRPRAIPGVEHVDRDAYRRIVHVDGVVGAIEVRRADGRDALALTLSPSLVPVVMPLVARVRRLFDLDARPDVIASVLGRDPLLGKLVAARPGLRLPGAIDGFEAAVRALLGQQVSVAAATTLAGRFAERFGAAFDERSEEAGGGDPTGSAGGAEGGAPRGVSGGAGLVRRFPTAAEVARAGTARIATIGLPGARAAAIHALASAVAERRLRLDTARELEPFVAEVIALPGVGPWTAHYLAMRALHLTDAFPAADLGIRKALGGTPRDAEARAKPWRPFRSYAVMHLWTSLGESNDDDVDDGDRSTVRPAAAVRDRGRAGRRRPAGPLRLARGARAQHGARARRAAARGVLRR